MTTSTPTLASIRSWVLRDDSAGILDVRPITYWYDRRIRGSSCIPFNELSNRTFELPDHHRSFAVLCLPSHHSAVTQLLHLWTNIQIFVMSSDDDTSSQPIDTCHDPFWKEANAIGPNVVVHGSTESHPAVSSLMFAPCSLISDSINTIEQLLWQRDSKPSHSPSLSHDVSTPSLTSSSTSTTTPSTTLHWRAIDLGCGAGRDVIYLARRPFPSTPPPSSTLKIPSVSTLTQPSSDSDSSRDIKSDSGVINNTSTTTVIKGPWHVVAVDQAIDRCRSTSISHYVSDRVTCIRARFKTDGSFVMMPPDDPSKLATKRTKLPELSQTNNTIVEQKTTLSAATTPPTLATVPTSPLSTPALPSADEATLTRVTSPVAATGDSGALGALMADGRRMRLPGSRPKKKDKSKLPSTTSATSTSSLADEKTISTSTTTTATTATIVAESPLIAAAPAYDLVLMIRFLERGLLPRMRSMVRIGGFVLIANFMVGCEKFGHPRDPNHILQPNELATFFGPSHGFVVLTDTVVIIPDGRPMNHFVAQRRS
jgi:hypothetical protein